MRINELNISKVTIYIRGGLGDFDPTNLHEQEFPSDNRAFIHIYGDLSYARKAGTATLFFWRSAIISRSAPSNFISARGPLYAPRVRRP